MILEIMNQVFYCLDPDEMSAVNVIGRWDTTAILMELNFGNEHLKGYIGTIPDLCHNSF